MSYAEAKAEAEASLSRSDSVSGFGVFVMFFPRFDDRIPAVPATSSTITPLRRRHIHPCSRHFIEPEHEGQGIDLLSGDEKGQRRVGTEQCQASQSLFEGGAWPSGLQGGIVIAGAYKAQQFQP